MTLLHDSLHLALKSNYPGWRCRAHNLPPSVLQARQVAVRCDDRFVANAHPDISDEPVVLLTSRLQR